MGNDVHVRNRLESSTARLYAFLLVTGALPILGTFFLGQKDLEFSRVAIHMALLGALGAILSGILRSMRRRNLLEAPILSVVGCSLGWGLGSEGVQTAVFWSGWAVVIGAAIWKALIDVREVEAGGVF